jgi:predicted ATPase/DNA-binding winged helix-turn-helix (wHTH) protein
MSCHRFGPFLLLASRRQLFEGSRPVKLGARALDLLIVLVERAGEVVSKQELMAQVWPQEVVEDNTLRVHMAALRKALGDSPGKAREAAETQEAHEAPRAPEAEVRYIANIAGRGYSLVVPVLPIDTPPIDDLATAPAPFDESPVTAGLTGRMTPPDPVPPPPRPGAMPPTDLSGWRALCAKTGKDGFIPAPLPPGFQQLPRPSGPLLGREVTVEALDRQLSRYGFVTLVGPGGIGKTSVALATARQVHPRYQEGLWFVDLATLPAQASPTDVAFGVARALGLSSGVEGLLDRLRAELGARTAGERRLLILDNCEHVVRAVTALVETLLITLPGLHLLLTSREPLRAVGEQVYLLPSLPLPGGPVPSMAEALHYPAVQLFVQRAQAADQTFDPSDADAGWITHICHGLDGVPLAIEHAAAMVRTFGLKALAASLDDRFLLLCGAHRNAISRHQNLQALLRWGYDLLSEPERRMLRWLSVVRGPIPLSDILSFVAPLSMDRTTVLDVVHSLVQKSWLFPRAGDQPSYRMHAMARSFAHQMLMTEQSGPTRDLPSPMTLPLTALRGGSAAHIGHPSRWND